MSPDELRDKAIQLYGPYGWQDALARDLGHDRSAVYRWASGKRRIPGSVEAAILCWLREADRCQGAGPDPA